MFQKTHTRAAFGRSPTAWRFFSVAGPDEAHEKDTRKHAHRWRTGGHAIRRSSFPLLLVLLPLAIELMVRLTGIRHGAPEDVYHPDVAKQTLVVQATYRGDSDPRAIFGKTDIKRCLYPYGMAVALGRAAKLYTAVTGVELAGVHRFSWALALRYMGVVIFCASVLIVLMCLYRLWGPVATLMTGFLLVLEPVGAQFNHYGMNDVPLLSLLLLSWICTAFMHGESSRLPLFSALAGLFAGLAFGVKYQGLLGLVFPGVAGLLLLRTKGWKWALAAGSAAATGFIVGVLVTTPLLLDAPVYFTTHFPEFMRWQANILNRSIPLSEKLSRNTMACVVLMARNNAWLLLSAGAATLVAAWKHPLDPPTRVLAAGAGAFCLLLTLAVITSRDIIRANDLIPVFGFLCVFPGLLLTRLPLPPKGRRPLRRWAITATAATLAVVFLTGSVRDAQALARPDTRRLAQAWCRQNIPTGARVVRERYTCRIAKEGVKEHVVRYLCCPAARDPVAAGIPDYVITSSLASGRFFDRCSPYHDKQAQTFYRGLEDTYRPLAVFRDRPLLYAQPTLTIYGKRGVE